MLSITDYLFSLESPVRSYSPFSVVFPASFGIAAKCQYGHTESLRPAFVQPSELTEKSGAYRGH